MSTGKHTPTPGPWELVALGSGYMIMSPRQSYTERDVCHVDRQNKTWNSANAELIVRAVNSHDDLLAACEAALATFYDKNCELGKQVQAAIAKSKGQP